MTDYTHIIPDNFYRISAKALILDDEKRFLLTKETNGIWELPGGGLDFGESPQECLAREIQEEMGVEVVEVAECPAYFLTATHDGSKYWMANVLYLTKVKSLEFTPSDECTEARFFTKEEALNENIYSSVAKFAKMFDPARH